MQHGQAGFRKHEKVMSQALWIII